jgi:catechol 2,3-dioxygenase-like lactoylglutathione lyase family enzyme
VQLRRIVRSIVGAMVVLSGAASAQGVADGPMAFATGGFIALSVPDLEASANWYAQRLGLVRKMAVARSGAMAGVVLLEGPGLTVELIQLDSARAGPERPELRYGIAKAGILVSNFDSTVARLRARGIDFFFGPYPPRPNNRANVAFKDNSGNLIQILGPYPEP